MNVDGFLVGQALTERLQTVARGKDVRIAAAFWSERGIETLFGKQGVGKAKLVCDVALGSTSAGALRALGAPLNEQLHHYECLHSKVFLSEHGLVVGSANVSGRALGDENIPASQLEAAVFHPAGSPAWVAARTWFDSLHENTPMVGQPEIDRALINYRPPVTSGTSRALRRGSLLDIVAASPERFAKISFAVTRRKSTKEEIEAARSSAKRLQTKVPVKLIDNWPEQGIFAEWDDEVVDRWSRAFVHIWLGQRTVSIFGYRGEVFDASNGSVLARQDWSFVRRSVDIPLPERSSIGAVDAVLARQLAEPGEGAFYADGAELAHKLAQIKAAAGS